jgi:hypothetical protein
MHGWHGCQADAWRDVHAVRPMLAFLPPPHHPICAAQTRPVHGLVCHPLTVLSAMQEDLVKRNLVISMPSLVSASRPAFPPVAMPVFSSGITDESGACQSLVFVAAA